MAYNLLVTDSRGRFSRESCFFKSLKQSFLTYKMDVITPLCYSECEDNMINECKVLGIWQVPNKCCWRVFFNFQFLTHFSPECFPLTLSKFYSVWINHLIKAFPNFSLCYSTFFETAVKVIDFFFKYIDSLILFFFNKYFWCTHFVPGTVQLYSCEQSLAPTGLTLQWEDRHN